MNRVGTTQSRPATRLQPSDSGPPSHSVRMYGLHRSGGALRNLPQAPGAGRAY